LIFTKGSYLNFYYIFKDFCAEKHLNKQRNDSENKYFKNIKIFQDLPSAIIKLP